MAGQRLDLGAVAERGRVHREACRQVCKRPPRSGEAVVRFLTTVDVLYIHFDLVERFFSDYTEDSSYGVLFQDRLEAAVGRPQQSVGLQDAYPTLAAKAAALTHSLILGHAFHDANKLTGMLAGVVFMDLNGCELVTDQPKPVRNGIGSGRQAGRFGCAD